MIIIDNRKKVLPALEADKILEGSLLSDSRIYSTNEFLELSLFERSDVAIIDVASIRSLKIDDHLLSRLNTFSGVIFFTSSPTDKNEVLWLEELMRLSDRPIALFELPLTKINVTIFSNLLQFLARQENEKNQIKQKMINFSQEIDELLKAAHQDMIRAKKLHEDLVPKRMEEHKGLSIYTKYGVGTGGGAEIVDVLKGQKLTSFFVSHTNSYLMSSTILGLVEKQKKLIENDHFELELLIEQIQVELEVLNKHKKRPVRVEICWMEYNHSTLELKIFSFGNFNLLNLTDECEISLNRQNIDVDFQEIKPLIIQLNRSDKLLLTSPGFNENWKDVKQKDLVDSFDIVSPAEPGYDLLMNLFFELRKNQEDQFLKLDASTILLEVSSNAIYKI